MRDAGNWQRFSARVSSLETRLRSLHAHHRTETDSRADALRDLEEAVAELHALLESLRSESSSGPAFTHDDLPAAVFTSDRRGVVVAVNDAACTLLATSAEDLVGTPLVAVVDGDRGPYRHALSQIVNAGGREHVAVVLRSPGSPPVPVTLVGARAGEPSRAIHWVAMSQDTLGSAGIRTAPASGDAEFSALAYAAVAQLALLPIASLPLPTLLAQMERLAEKAFPDPVQVHLEAARGTSPPLASSGGVTMPLRGRGQRVGTMHVIPPDGADLDESSRAAATLFAHAAGAVLDNVLALEGTRELADGLTRALENRATIEQAKGILMAVKGCSASDAFDQLRVASQKENLKLYEVARRVVRTAHPDSV